MLDRDVLERQFEHEREVGAEKIDPLAVGPDADAILRPLRHGAGRRDRGMRQIGTAILPPHRARLFDRAGRRLVVDNDGLRRLGFQPLRQRGFIGQRCAGRPCCALAQGFERGLGAVFGFADDACEISVAHDRDKTGNGARAVFRKVDEFCSGELRSQHAAMQHPRQRLVVNETPMRKNLVWNIHPLNRTSGKRAPCRSFGCRTRRRVTIQRDVAGELPVAGPDIAGSGDGAILDLERVDIDAQPIGGDAEKDLPDLGAGLPDGAAGLLHRKTA